MGANGGRMGGGLGGFQLFLGAAFQIIGVDRVVSHSLV